MKVIDLMPGIKILDPVRGSHTYVAQCPHPLYKRLQLVIWRLADGTWSHDALSPVQDVGDPDLTQTEYEQNLREAFHE